MTCQVWNFLEIHTLGGGKLHFCSRTWQHLTHATTSHVATSMVETHHIVSLFILPLHIQFLHEFSSNRWSSKLGLSHHPTFNYPHQTYRFQVRGMEALSPGRWSASKTEHSRGWKLSKLKNIFPIIILLCYYHNSTMLLTAIALP